MCVKLLPLGDRYKRNVFPKTFSFNILNLCGTTHSLEHAPVEAPAFRRGSSHIDFQHHLLGAMLFAGDGSLVETNSTVVKDVASNTLVGGNPARLIKKLPQGLGPGHIVEV
jgi:hypothetical protein